MHTRSQFLLIALLLSVLAGAQTLAAGTLFDNFSQASADDYRLVYAYPADHVWGEVAQSFSTGSSAYELTMVTLSMNYTIAGSVFVDLYSNAAGVPGSLLGTLSILDSPSQSFSSVRFDGDGLALSANTTYWILMRATSGNYSWQTTLNPQAGTGLTRTEYHTGWFPGYIDTLGNQVMKVEGNAAGAVPEPSTLLYGLPVLALFLLRRNRH